MVRLSATLQRALESDCADDLGEIIKAKREADFEKLREIVSSESTIDRVARTRAIYALGRWGDRKAVPDILKVMPNLDESGLLTAVDALGRLGAPAALQGILEYADNQSPDVRKFVVRALGRFDEPEAQAKLMEIHQRDQVEHIRILARKYVDRISKDK